MTAGETAAVPSTTWSCLRYPIFRAFWATSLLSFLGVTMQSMGAAWLMAELTDSPLFVSLVQASMSFSIFVASLPGGVIADMFDRRRVMLASLFIMMSATSLIGVLALTELITPLALLVITFAFGASAAFMSPAYQASLPSLVPRGQLPSALTLGSMANSSARAIGPAIAGYALAAIGAGWMLVLNAFSFAGQSIVLLVWKNPQQKSHDGESFNRSMLVGLRYVRYTPDIVYLMIRGAGSFFFLSALLALLPMIVKVNLDGEPQSFGFLLSTLGIGAVISALFLSTFYKWASRNTVVTLASALHAMCIFSVGMATSIFVAAAAMFLAGLAMTALLTSLMITTQMILPEWVRARGISISFMATMGSLALAAAVWGQIAELTSPSQSLTIASALGLLVALMTHPFRVKNDSNRHVDLAPSDSMPAPSSLTPGYRGPLKVEIEYRVDAASTGAFQTVMKQVRLVRLRNGSKDWSLANDPDHPGRFTETYMERDWSAYVRHRRRVTVDESSMLEEALAFHAHAHPPEFRVSPVIGANV